MHLDKPPRQFKKDFNPTAQVDHREVVAGVDAYIAAHGDVAQVIAEVRQDYRAYHPDLTKRIQARTRFIKATQRSAVSRLDTLDEVGAFNNAGALGFLALEHLAARLDVPNDLWQLSWADAPSRFDFVWADADQPRPDADWNALAQHFITSNISAHYLQRSAYKELFSRHRQTITDSTISNNVMTAALAGYGYVMHCGQQQIYQHARQIAIDQSVQAAVDSSSDWQDPSTVLNNKSAIGRFLIRRQLRDRVAQSYDDL